MATIPTEQVHQRLRQDNPWWQGGSEPEIGEASSYRSRFYLDLLLPLLQDRAIRRAIVLLGPRRVGKTVLVHHAVRELLRAGHPAGTIAYITVDHPVYKGLGLEDFLDLLQQARGLDPRREPYFVFFDEIQYLREWELHLKALVDSYPNLRCLPLAQPPRAYASRAASPVPAASPTFSCRRSPSTSIWTFRASES
jgi:uncharacterized protein